MFFKQYSLTTALIVLCISGFQPYFPLEAPHMRIKLDPSHNPTHSYILAK